MSNESDKIDGVRGVTEHEGAKLRMQGVVSDLSRGNLIVHVGKPVGSITGWAGPLFWQVWVEPSDAIGIVRARIDQGAVETWQFDGELEKAQVLDAAKDRIIAQAEALRSTLLVEAKARLSELNAA